MALHITNPAIVAKVELLARTLGLSEEAAVETAVDALLTTLAPSAPDRQQDRLRAILAQLDRVPDLPAPVDPFAWDSHGLPT